MALEKWKGEFGDDYTARNQDSGRVSSLTELWREILRHQMPYPLAALEVGANVGHNLVALKAAQATPVSIYGVEPNDSARSALANVVGRDSVFESIDEVDRSFDLVFTSGVLIHIPPEELLGFCRKIYDRAESHIACIEYFSDEPVMVPYRGNDDMLWKRDFGSFWLDNFRSLVPLKCGFAWKRMTGLDNVTYWLFRKP